jgi:hypothetical protein
VQKSLNDGVNDHPAGRGATLSPGNSAHPLSTFGFKQKEADKITASNWPSPPGFRHWRVTLLDEIIAASAFPDLAFEWIRVVSDKNITYEQLGKSDFPKNYPMHLLMLNLPPL